MAETPPLGLTEFSVKVVSDSQGNLSSMRIAYLAGMVTFILFTFVIMFCLLWVVMHKDEFPAGFWAAIASVVGGISSLQAGKLGQSYLETKAVAYSQCKPNLPNPGSESE